MSDAKPYEIPALPAFNFTPEEPLAGPGKPSLDVWRRGHARNFPNGTYIAVVDLDVAALWRAWRVAQDTEGAEQDPCDDPSDEAMARKFGGWLDDLSLAERSRRICGFDGEFQVPR